MSEASINKEKILVIEGDKNFGQKIKESLDKDGYDCVLVQNGDDGFNSIVSMKPHLVILDITLLESDGYEVLQKKNSNQSVSKIPLFLMSTQGVPINMQKVPQGSVTEFIVTFESNPSEVVNKVNHYFNKGLTSGSSAQDGERKKVLWVEDDKLIGSILSKKLVASNFDLFHAKNGEEALEALEESIPCVVVLDLLLPGMSGFDILQKLKSNDKHKDIPVMILSNMNRPSDLERARVLGAQKFLVKAAYSLDQIVLEIRGLCR